MTTKVHTGQPRPFTDAMVGSQSPIALTWSRSSVISASNNFLLHPTSGVARAGLTALIGPTGAGKSTFLNLLAGQSHGNVEVGGAVVLNGKTVRGDSAKTILSYVPQEDALDGNLTVLECLAFAARMQLGHMSDEARATLVDQLIEEVGLSHVKDTLIGTPLKRGVSGGQRKRVAVAVGLLRQPRVIILDEPTCGLDSTCALALIRTLKALSQKGTVVIMAIHQPQQAIFELFDSLLCIRGGRIIYQGGALDCIPYMESIGIHYDGVTAHADHIIEVISPSIGQSMEDKERVCPLMHALQEFHADVTEHSDIPVTTNVTNQTWAGQTIHLIGRLATAEYRKFGSHIMNVVCTLGCALLVSAAYYNVPMTQQGTKLRLALLFFCCINQSLFGAMKVILSFPEARTLLLAERRAGFYSLSPYLVAFSIVDLTYTIVWPILFALPVVFLTNLESGAQEFFGFVLMLYLDKICATSLALMITSLARSASASVVFLPMAIEVSRLFSGFYLTPAAIPTYFEWLDPLSYVKYAFVGSTLNELPRQVYACAGANATFVGRCDSTLPRTGYEIISANGYGYITYGGCVGALLAYVVFTRFVTYAALRFLKSN